MNCETIDTADASTEIYDCAVYNRIVERNSTDVSRESFKGSATFQVSQSVIDNQASCHSSDPTSLNDYLLSDSIESAEDHLPQPKISLNLGLKKKSENQSNIGKISSSTEPRFCDHYPSISFSTDTDPLSPGAESQTRLLFPEPDEDDKESTKFISNGNQRIGNKKVNKTRTVLAFNMENETNPHYYDSQIKDSIVPSWVIRLKNKYFSNKSIICENQEESTQDVNVEFIEM